MKKTEFFENLNKCISYIKNKEFKTINYEDIDRNKYHSEYSLISKNGYNIEFGLYSESIFETNFVSNSKLGRKIKKQPNEKEYIEYLLNKDQFLEYIIYHYHNQKEIWKFFLGKENERIGIKSDKTCLVLSITKENNQSEFHRLMLDINNTINFEYTIENSKIENKTIECIRSVYNCSYCNVEKLQKVNNKYQSERISYFNFNETTINEMIKILQLNENESCKYLEEINSIRLSQKTLYEIDKQLHKDELLIRIEEENENSFF